MIMIIKLNRMHRNESMVSSLLNLIKLTQLITLLLKIMITPGTDFI